jgi:hypothetical protein
MGEAQQITQMIAQLALQQQEREQAIMLQLQERDQAIMLQLHEVRSNVKVTNCKLTPSSDCESSAEIPYTNLMEVLGLTRVMNVLHFTVVGETTSACLLPIFPKFSWGDLTEASGYPALIDYLRKAGLHPRDVSNGQSLPHGHLFNTDIHSLRPLSGVTSGVLRKSNLEPKLKYNISGTSDIICLDDTQSNISRGECLLCIEVKRVQDMEGDAAVNKALREGVLQLIGLNAGNPYKSPPVIVTNLSGKHYVLFISKQNGEDKVKFDLNVQRFNSLSQALFRAQHLTTRGCITQLFGSAPTPPHSSDGSIGNNDDDEDEADSECKVQVVEVN